MQISILLINSFKFLCFCTTAFMEGYWIYKYQKNDDVTLIEYRSLHEKVDFAYPDVTICLANPELKNEHINITKEANFTQRYQDYVMGIEMNETLKNLDYEMLTPNLFEYIELVTVHWKNGTYGSCRNTNSCPYLTFKNIFDGFLGSQFSKCFGIEIEKGYALDIQDGVIILFKDDLNLLLNQVNMVQVLFNYRNQFIRPIGGVQNVWAKKKKRAEIFQITSLDVVTRRNTKENPCLLNWKKYDECVMIQHFKTAGCRAPYHIKYKYISICSTKEEMEKASKNVFGLNMDAPCYEMPYIDFKYNYANRVFGRPDVCDWKV